MSRVVAFNPVLDDRQVVRGRRLFPRPNGAALLYALTVRKSIAVPEQIFSLDGMGLLFFESLLARDFPVLMGIITLASLTLVIGNLVTDFLYVVVDPRIDFRK